ncbi:alcohol dehydrogenase catalytic domain-containing protein [Citrifermentans bemidjiense]|uniref:alcohol dehydrogenase catalytic domain-containing protein n=1 Tax=Citrifermentans bemidjiense TaxID=225194 RepID=UPI00014FA71D|nr:alcohol dehydrogenase catalytic domain-containing protein [Citrifermentans bemidjiense]
MSDVMDAAVITGPGRSRVEQVARPAAGRGEVVVRVEGCGVCASNLPLWQGRFWFNYPAQPGSPGHEGWGRVHRLGEGVEGIAVGDRVIEATGYQWPLDVAGELVRERGKIVIAGFHQDGMRQVNVQLWNWKGVDVINAHERDPKVYLEGMLAGIEAVDAGLFALDELITHTYALEHLGEAYRALDQRPDGFLKGIVRIDH